MVGVFKSPKQSIIHVIEHVQKLKKEMEEFQTQRDEELQRLNEYKNQETKKLKQDRKLFEAFQKQQQAAASKKENQEIEGELITPIPSNKHEDAIHKSGQHKQLLSMKSMLS